MQGQCWGQYQGKPAWEPVIWKKNRRKGNQTKVKLNLFPLWSLCLTCKVCVWFMSFCAETWNEILIYFEPPLMSLLLQNCWHWPCSKFHMFVYPATNVQPVDVLGTNTLVWGLDIFMLRAKMCSLDAKQLRSVQTLCKYVCVSAQVVSSLNRKRAHLQEHHEAVKWYNMTW